MHQKMLESVRSHREWLYNAGHAVGETGVKTALWPAGLTQGAGDHLRDLVAREKATLTVEVGLGLGLSSLAMLEGLLSTGCSGCSHVTIDPGQEWCDRAGVQAIRESGATSITTVVEKPSGIALAQLWDEGRKFDVAFVDGAHWFDSVLVDLCLVRQVVRPGGLIVLDDHWMPSIQMVLAFVVSNMGFSLELFDPKTPGGRLVAIRNTDAPDRREWDHFAPFSRSNLPEYPWKAGARVSAGTGA